jgi:tetratricopeptide (TPR) repeat protein
LDSWKSIAEYLERSTRTVQRWHAYHGLPVHHFGGNKGSVFGYAEEIDHWLVNLVEETRSAEMSEDDALEARKKRSFELMARAQEMWDIRSEDNINIIASLCRKAIDQYPGNTAAYIGLANSMIMGALEGVIDGSVAYNCAIQALRHTAQLDTEDLEAKCSAAWLNLVYEHKWHQARTGFEEVLSKQPENCDALAGLSLLLVVEGNLADGSYCAGEAWKQNTMVCSLGAFAAWSQYLAGNPELALHMIAQVRASGGSGAVVGAVEALALIQASPVTANITRIEVLAYESPQNQTLQGALGYAYAISGQTSRAWEIFQQMEQLNEMSKRSSGYALALIRLGLGKRQDAVEWLEAAFDEGALWSIGFRSDPLLRPLSGEPRFEMLLRKAGPAIGNSAQVMPSRPYEASAV